MKLRLPTKPSLSQVIDLLVQVLILVYIASYFSPGHLFSHSTTSGGDTASHYYTAQYLKDYLLPHGKILGWMQGNFAGFPVFQFYFPMPFVLMVVLSYAIGLQIAFKIVSALGVFLLPICTYFAFRWLGFRFPTPSLASLFTLPFLFMEANSMWGGNIPSTLAGEFTNSIGLALMVLFAGSCYRGILENRWAVRNGILLALVGFNHGYTLLFAVAFSTYYLLALPGLAKNLKYLLKVHGLAFCLMGFWILPLLGYSPFTTRYNFIWVIGSWKEILPEVLWPLLALAAAFTLYKLARLAWPKWREAFDHRVGLLWYILGLSYLFYLIAFRIHVVDIRFLPFLQLFIGLLAAVPIGLLALHLRANWMVLVILVPLTLVWTESRVTFIRQWIAWNYSGFESKSLWPAFSAVNTALKGTEADPRVVYEHSPEHNAAGTVRAFESLPLFSGRNTLEGLYMQSSISSPFVFYIQSEISEVTSCPLPDYHCSTLNLQHAAEHLRLFNVREFITRSEAVKRAIRLSPDFELKQVLPPFEIYRLKGNEDRYVAPLSYQPVLLQTADWKMDFYNWFKRPGTGQVHLVHLFDQDEKDTSRFPLKVSALPAEIPKQTLDGQVRVSERVSQEEIRISTDKIGHPLLIRISYHPRWRVEGAEKIYLASPSFMLIYPAQKEVRLVFGDPPLVRFGHLLTTLAAALILASWAPVHLRIHQVLAKAEPALAHPHLTAVRTLAAQVFARYDRHRAWLAPSIIFTSVLAAVLFAFAIQQTDASVLYNQGLESFTKQRYEEAATLFEKAMLQNPNSPSAINSNYYFAICQFKQDRWDKTIEIFSDMVRKYPDSVYIPEAEYHIGLCLQKLGQKEEAVARLQSIIDRFPASPWANHAKNQLAPAGAPRLQAVRLTPSPSGARPEYSAAIALYDQNRLEEAEKAFRAVVDKYPNDDLADDAYMHYCFTLFRREMYWQTIKELRIMLDRYSKSPWIPEARYHIGLSLMRLGQIPQAVAEFEWILRSAPDSRWAGFARERLAETRK